MDERDPSTRPAPAPGEGASNAPESSASNRARSDGESPRADSNRARSDGESPRADSNRARAGRNREALEYYRSRSRAPGVASGGTERNFYCMECDGVIPFDAARTECPHCGAQVDPRVRRYFNWVEINETPRGDARFVLLCLLGLALLGLVAWIVL